MQANRSCSGVPIPREELERRERDRQLKRQRSTVSDRRPSRLRTTRGRLIVKPEPEMNCRSSTTDRGKDRIAEDQLKPQQVVPEGRNVPLVVDRVCGSQRNSVNKDRYSRTLVPPATVEAELNRVGDSSHYRSPDRSHDAATAPRKRLTVFTIESLLSDDR